MKITYDPETDTLTVVLKDAPVAESDEVRPGLILDIDVQGSRQVTDPRHVEFTVVADSPPRPHSLGIAASGHTDTARRSADERPLPPER